MVTRRGDRFEEKRRAAGALRADDGQGPAVGMEVADRPLRPRARLRPARPADRRRSSRSPARTARCASSRRCGARLAAEGRRGRGTSAGDARPTPPLPPAAPTRPASPGRSGSPVPPGPGARAAAGRRRAPRFRPGPPPCPGPPPERTSPRTSGRGSSSARAASPSSSSSRFFVRYAWENDWVGPTGRVLSGAVFSLALVAGGLRILGREYRPLGQGLAAAGFAGLYVTAFAAHAVYALVPRGAAAAFMIVVTACAVVVADRLDTRLLAGLAWVGGYLTPAPPLDRRGPGGEPLRLPAAARGGRGLARPAQALAGDPPARPRGHPAPLRRLVRGPLPAGALRGRRGRPRRAHRALRRWARRARSGAAGLAGVLLLAVLGLAQLVRRRRPAGGAACSSLSASPFAALRTAGRPRRDRGPASRPPRWPCPSSPGRSRTTGRRASGWPRRGSWAGRCSSRSADRRRRSRPASCPASPSSAGAPPRSVWPRGPTGRPRSSPSSPRRPSSPRSPRGAGPGRRPARAALAALAVLAWYDRYFRPERGPEALALGLGVAGLYVLVLAVEGFATRRALGVPGAVAHVVAAGLAWTILDRVLGATRAGAPRAGRGGARRPAPGPRPRGRGAWATTSADAGHPRSRRGLPHPRDPGPARPATASPWPGRSRASCCCGSGRRQRSPLARAFGYGVLALAVCRLFVRHLPAPPAGRSRPS